MSKHEHALEARTYRRFARRCEEFGLMKSAKAARRKASAAEKRLDVKESYHADN